VGLGVFCDKPPLTVPVRDPYYLALDKRKFIFIFPLKVEEGNSFAMHFFIRRGYCKLIIPRIA
jgi:hypothetical protein